MKKNMSRLLCGFALMAVAVLAAACSSSSSSTSSSHPASSSAAPVAAPKGSPIEVGVVCSCSGEAGFSEFNVPGDDSIEAWADAVNAAGGIDGHPVKVIAEDDQTNPGTSASDAQTLINDHVVAIIDNTTLVSSWSSAVAAANIPVVGAYTINAPFLTSPDFYAEGQTNNSTLASIVAVAKQAGAKNIANMYCLEAPVCAQSTPYIEAAGKADGVPDVYNVGISATAPNYTAQCLAAKQANVDSVFIGDASTVIANVANSCSQQGYNPIYVTEGAGLGLNLLGAPGLSSLWSEYPDIPFWDSSVPAVKTYDTIMDKYYPGVREDKSIYIEDNLMSYISAKLVQAGIEAGGLTSSETPTAAELTKGLDSIKNDTLDGLAPPLTFTAGQPHLVNCYFVGHVSNGKMAIANGGKPECTSNASS